MSNRPKVISIMQPTYLPWSGYFNLIKRSHIFVFLDDVQFDKRSWQQRNRILVNKKEHFLTIPVLNANKFNQKIMGTEIDESQKWRKTHLSTIEHNYLKHDFGFQAIDLFKQHVFETYGTLSRVNSSFILGVKEKLGLEAEIVFSSSLNLEGRKSEKLINIFKHFGGDIYLSPLGSKNYIEEEALFEKENISVEYQDFVPLEYKQKGMDSFVPYMSLIDLIANVGYEEAVNYF